MGKGLYYGFSWEEMSKAGQAAVIGLLCLNNFSGLWVTGVVPSYPAPGCEVNRAEGYCLLDCESQREEMVWSMDTGLVTLHMEGMLTGRLLAVSRNQLTLGGAIPPLSTRPQDTKAS